MINFEEELKNYEPSQEAEDAINNRELADVTDLLREMLEEIRKDYRR